MTEHKYSMDLIQRMWVDRYESLPENVKRNIDLLHNTNKSSYQLKEIKKKRPKLEKGDVFALKVSEGLYFYGVIINGPTDIRLYGKNLIVVCIFNIASRLIEPDAVTGFDTEKILVGPAIISRSYWARGLFFNVGKRIDIPLDFSYGFHQAYGLRREKSLYVDEYGNDLLERPEFIHHHGLTTDIGIAYYLHKELIIDDSFLSSECREIYRAHLDCMLQDQENEELFEIDDENAEKIGSFIIMDNDDSKGCTILFNDFTNYCDLFSSYDKGREGNGYDWEDIFKTYVKNNYANRANMFDYDSEADLMCVYSKNRDLAIKIVSELENEIQNQNFSSIIEQTEFLTL